MHHIKRRPRHMFCQAHDAAEGKVFRKRIMHLRHILKPCAIFAEDLGVHMHDNVIIFGVDHAKPALGREHLKHFPDIAEIHHAALAGRRDISREDFRGGVAGFNRLTQLRRDIRRQIAFHHDVIGVVARAAISLPSCFPFRNGAFDGFAMGPAHEIQNAGGAAIKRSAAHHGCALGLFQGSIRPGNRPKAMRVRVNAARHHYAIASFHHAHTGRRGKAARRGNGDDLFPRNADFRRADRIRRDNTIALDHQIHGNTPAWRVLAPSGGSLNPNWWFRPTSGISAAAARFQAPHAKGARDRFQ